MRPRPHTRLGTFALQMLACVSREKGVWLDSTEQWPTFTPLFREGDEPFALHPKQRDFVMGDT